MEKYRYYRREFLNSPGFHSTAFILATVERTRPRDAGCAYVTFELSDCWRKLSLSIDSDDPETRANDLAKLDLVIETLMQFRRAVRVEAGMQARREARRCPRPYVGTADPDQTQAPQPPGSGPENLPRAIQHVPSKLCVA